MVRYRVAGLCLAAMASAAWGDPPAASPPLTMQQRFDQATEAWQADKCEVALPLFAELASDPRVKPGSVAAGAVATRQGSCLLTTGKADEGEALIAAGLPILAKAGPAFDNEVAKDESALGKLAARRWDHDAAVSHFEAALAREAGEVRLLDLVPLSRVRAFDSGPEGLAAIDEAMRIAGGLAKPDRALLATLHTLRGRILMNRGENQAAYAELKQALSLSGGLTGTVNLDQSLIRGDLAQAAVLNGEPAEARRYLSYTGAGRLDDMPSSEEMRLPPCGVQTGLRPEDSAIVEFGIDADGDAANVHVAYTRGNYAVAAAFGQAVSRWHWPVDTLKTMSPFFKVLSRLELRCTNGGDGANDAIVPLISRFVQAAEARFPGERFDGAPRGTKLARLNVLATQAEQNGDPATAALALGLKAIDDTARAPKTIRHAIELARKAGLPAETINALRIWEMQEYTLSRDSPVGSTSLQAPMLALADEKDVSGDALAQDTARLLAVPATPKPEHRAPARTLLSAVADDARLPERDPLRQLALLQLANIAAADGRYPEAQAFFRRTGLSEQQCALIGPKPVMRATGASGNDYPTEAFSMGFEGWVNLEFDIQADGLAANARATIAYPPFVFVDGATKMAKGFRFTATYRPEGGEACSANREFIKFRHN